MRERERYRYDRKTTVQALRTKCVLLLMLCMMLTAALAVTGCLWSAERRAQRPVGVPEGPRMSATEGAGWERLRAPNNETAQVLETAYSDGQERVADMTSETGKAPTETETPVCGPLSGELALLLADAAEEFDIPYELALAVVEQESDGRNLVGDGGDSVGYMQIQRRWWADLMAEIGAEDLCVARDNFRTGCAILALLLDEHGSTEDALTAYNTGRPGTSSYATAVMARMEGGWDA